MDRTEPPAPAADRVSVAGYAVGFGAAFAAVAGTWFHFAYPDVPDLISIGGSFLVGAAIGGTWARLRRVSLSERRRG